MSSLALSDFGNLLHILRRANTHYSHIASIFRMSIHPTHHARKRAAALKLTVSIQKALKLDPKQISTIPLPVLDTAHSPIDLSRGAVGHEHEVAPVRPLLKCTEVPSTSPFATPVLSCVPLTLDSFALTSCWYMTPIDANTNLTQGLPEGVVITYDADYDQDMVLCSPIEGGESLRFKVQPGQLNLFPPRADDSNKLRHSDIPDDVTDPLSWGSDISSPGSLMSTGSPSTTSSDGPDTPVSIYLQSLHHFTKVSWKHNAQKFMIHTKRKSPEMDDDVLEKCPKVRNFSYYP